MMLGPRRHTSSALPLCLVGLLLSAAACSDPVSGPADETPEQPVLPPDPRIEWDPKSQMVQVPSTIGCDSWTPTWAPDGNLYTAYGDCRPQGVPRRIGMGFGRISGDAGYNVSFMAVPTGDPADWDDAASGTGVEAVGDGPESEKPAGMLVADGRLWYWIRNISAAGTGVRLKFSDNYDSPLPTFTWVDWSVPEVGYASFVQYGQDYEGGPADYVYAVIPMSASGVSNSAYDMVPGFSLMRGSRTDLTLQANWEFFCGSASTPAWCPSPASASPIFLAPELSLNPRAGMSWNQGLGKFMLSLVYDTTPATPNEGTRFYGGLIVLISSEPWGPWQTVFTSEGQIWPGGTSTPGCGST
ncbi:MAG TPA: hypothetical protein VHH32_09800, partial [Gemmatimonadales bacterium]|nr:hypothetical protein [Gemmatimonadales bacterium]